MVANETGTAMRELTASELSDVGGGLRFDLFGYRLFLFGGEGWASACVADSERYACVTAVRSGVYTSSGPVPQ